MAQVASIVTPKAPLAPPEAVEKPSGDETLSSDEQRISSGPNPSQDDPAEDAQGICIPSVIL